MALLAHAAGLLVSTSVQPLLYKLTICNQEEHSADPHCLSESGCAGRRARKSGRVIGKLDGESVEKGAPRLP